MKMWLLSKSNENVEIVDILTKYGCNPINVLTLILGYELIIFDVDITKVYNKWLKEENNESDTTR